ncbi:FecR domain-containing protein [Pseudomonas sp. PDNC002]|nr:FecR domain-containing protein [Pseudomonas sp. PDNC002]
MEQAAQWFAQLNAHPEDRQLHARWQQWHAQSTQNRQAWGYVERIGQRFQPLLDDNQLAAQTLRSARTLSRRRTLQTLAVLSGGTLLGLVGWRHGALREQWASWSADYQSGSGEIREFRLADDSHCWLGGDSALDVDFSGDSRRLLLRSGEILIDTAKDRRPFFVETAQGRLQALGTRFSVTQQEAATRLAVFEGAVEIALSGQRKVVPAGQQTSFDGQHIGALQAVDPAREAWSRGVLLANDLSLSEFIAELIPYRRGYLGVSPEVARLRVMGSFPLHDSDRALDMLASILPVRIQRTLPWWVSIEPRP